MLQGTVFCVESWAPKRTLFSLKEWNWKQKVFELSAGDNIGCSIVGIKLEHSFTRFFMKVDLRAGEREKKDFMLSWLAPVVPLPHRCLLRAAV